MARTHYDVLMLSPLADRGLITVAYRHLAKRYHPDKDASPMAAARMVELNEAYAVLSDREKRARYDASITGGTGNVSARTIDGPPAQTKAAAAAATAPAGPDFGEAGPPPTNPPAAGRPLTFGRYRGWTLNQVGRYDRDYLEWLSRTTMGRNWKGELDELLRHR